LIKRKKHGFTLLEVVIALAVFGFLIGGLMGFLPWGVQGVGKVREQSIAYGLVDAIEIELERMGFSLVESSTKRLEGMNNPENKQEGENVDDLKKDFGGLINFNSTTLGGSTQPVSLIGFNEEDETKAPFSYRWIPESDRYFLIKITQFPFGHRHQHHVSNGFLALEVDIQWPYKVPVPPDDFRRVPERFRSHFRFPIAISR
jgi:prepilin-type N-terminal cleavage/methylation domain-containing protein